MNKLDPRSWFDQGRFDLHGLREPKMLHGNSPEAVKRRAEIEELRRLRRALPPAGEPMATLDAVDADAERKIAAITARADAEVAALEQEFYAARDRQR